jgi:lambda family phage tail tape measure protein
MANMIARLGVLLGLDTAEFNKGLADAGRKLDEFTAKAQRGAVVAGTAFAALTTKAMAYADEISDVAKANDVAIDSVIKLQNALANSGGKAEDAGKILASFSNYVDKAAEGSFEAQKLFAKLGVSLQDLGKLSSEELFGKVIKGISEIDDPITRAAKGMDIFGKAARGVDFVGVAEGMEKASAESQAQADAIEKLATLYDKLAQSGRDFLLKFIKEFGPMISDTYDYFQKLSNGGEMLKNIFKTVAETVLILGANVAYLFTQIYKEFETIAKQIGALTRGDLDEFSRLHKEAVERAKKDRADLDAFEQKILGGAGGGRGFVNPALVSPGGAPGVRRQVKPGVDKEAEAAAKEAAKRAAEAHRRQLQELELLSHAEVSYGKVVSAIVDYQNAQERRLEVEERLAEFELRRQGMAGYEFEYQRKRIELEHQHKEALLELQNMELLPDDRAKRIEKQNLLYQRQIDLLKEVRDTEELKRTGDVTKGFMEAAKDFFQNLPTEMETGAAMFGSMMGNMNNALDSFVRTGKLNFKDFARSVILDLIAIQLKAQAMKLFANLFSFGNPTTSAAGSVDYSFAGMKMNFGGPKASGGSVSSDSAYMVGERGPEIFVPRMSGSIIPNNALGAMGNTNNVTNNYINAIDVKSFEERIMGSSNAVWAANIYAQKRLPLGAGRM